MGIYINFMFIILNYINTYNEMKNRIHFSYFLLNTIYIFSNFFL